MNTGLKLALTLLSTYSLNAPTEDERRQQLRQQFLATDKILHAQTARLEAMMADWPPEPTPNLAVRAIVSDQH